MAARRGHQGLTPPGGDPPPGLKKQLIEADSVAACKHALAEAALAQFGTGWAWLVLDGKKIL